MRLRELPVNDSISRWVDEQESADSARACLRYAVAFNSLDASWLENSLSPFATYDSQSVHINGAANPLRGRDAVFYYWSDKIKTLRNNPSRRPRFELATTSLGQPCAAGFQPAGDFYQNWLQKPVVNLALGADIDGLIISALMITVAPDPASCSRSGIFPGIEVPVKETPRNFIRPSSGFEGLRFSFFLLDGKMRLDKRMVETAQLTLANFPEAKSKLMIWQEMSDSEMGELTSAQFSGFPAVAVYYLDQCIFRHQGLISPESLTEAVKGVSKLHVV
jgi:hypothetical protein